MKTNSKGIPKIPLAQTIGETLTDLRESQGLTQKQFSKKFYIAHSTYAHYEQGRTIPNSSVLLKFADYFQVPTDYILGRCKCKIEYQKMNTKLSKNVTLGEMLNAVSKMSVKQKEYLYQTIQLLVSSDKLK